MLLSVTLEVPLYEELSIKIGYEDDCSYNVVRSFFHLHLSTGINHGTNCYVRIIVILKCRAKCTE